MCNVESKFAPSDRREKLGIGVYGKSLFKRNRQFFSSRKSRYRISRFPRKMYTKINLNVTPHAREQMKEKNTRKVEQSQKKLKKRTAQNKKK